MFIFLFQYRQMDKHASLAYDRTGGKSKEGEWEHAPKYKTHALASRTFVRSQNAIGAAASQPSHPTTVTQVFAR